MAAYLIGSRSADGAGNVVARTRAAEPTPGMDDTSFWALMAQTRADADNDSGRQCGPYEAAVRDPDSLATKVQDAETGDWDNADSRARRVRKRHGRVHPGRRL